MVWWDPDGVGPNPGHLVVAGDFAAVANTVALRIAAFDPATGQWQPLGAGLNGTVLKLAALANGELVATGGFTQAGGVAANGIARWNGTAWAPLGSGTRANSLLALPNGDLLAARANTSGTVSSIQRWDGVAWTPFAQDVAGAVNAMALLQNGDLVAAGLFSSAGGVPAANIARWNGAVWAPLGSGLGGSGVNQPIALTVRPNGDLIAGGHFTLAGGQAALRVAQWDGSAWSPLGNGMVAGGTPYTAHVQSLQTLANGDVIAGGWFNSAGGVGANCVACWRNGAWSSPGSGVDNQVDTVAELPNGDIVVGGAFLTVAGVTANHLARWDGVAWSTFGAAGGCDADVATSTALANGDLILGGSFSQVNGVPANRVARRSGGTWTALGSGVGGAVHASAELANGDVIVGGQFGQAGGVGANNIARWNGATWFPLGLGTGGRVQAVVALPNGDVIAGGSFPSAGGQPASNVARWNGVAWSPLATGVAQPVKAIAMLGNGNLVVGTNDPSGFVARIEVWNGATWSTLVSIQSGIIESLLALPNGDLLAAGSLTAVGGTSLFGIARWNGIAWSSLQLGTGSSPTIVRTLALLPNGDVLAGGTLTPSNQASNLARWDGNTWQSLGQASLGHLPTAGPVHTIAVSPNGEIAVGGSFSSMGDSASPRLAMLTTPCPATAAVSGAGCSGSGGPNQLVATALPWVGNTFRARATGMPPQGFVAVVTGFTALAVPLLAIFPQAGGLCVGHNSADAIALEPPVGGTVTTQLAIPNDRVLVGVVFHQYALPFELDALGGLVAVTSSNGLALTVGHL